jgi:hypothetical protein
MKVFLSHGFDADDTAGHHALDGLCDALRQADARIDPFTTASACSRAMTGSKPCTSGWKTAARR